MPDGLFVVVDECVSLMLLCDLPLLPLLLLPLLKLDGDEGEAVKVIVRAV